ncbi:LCP family protein [Schaalia sp. JY-X159]|uniref:LCP family protein n=1 Tax=Schaalia sp. JY-X159 TaxID=2758575 RepID=UPI00165D805A|nr:LCP family protein [Schaalia sp. JY-X159]
MSTKDTEQPMSATPAHSATRRRSWMWLSVLLAAVLGVVLFVGTAGAILYNSLNHQAADSVLDTSHLRAQPQSAQSADEEPEQLTDSFAGREVNILLMGIDSRQDQDASIINPEDNDDTIRSDTTLMLNLSADRQHVNIISIPRDMWVYLPECQRTDGSVSYAQWGQFNWAFSYGSLGSDLAGGVNCTEALTEEITGISSDGFAVIDFTGFSRMIEALGGVDICLPDEINDPEYLDLVIPAGCQRLDPTTATQLARVRHTGDGSDMGRIQRQHLLLGAMVQEAMGQNILTDTPKLYAFLSTALDALRLSPSLSNLRTDAGLATSLTNTPPENFRFLAMPVVTADFDANRLLPKEPQNAEFWQAIKDGTQLPAGTVYSDLNGNYFTVGENGEVIEGGNPRTDDEIGSLTYGDDGY